MNAGLNDKYVHDKGLACLDISFCKNDLWFVKNSLLTGEFV